LDIGDLLATEGLIVADGVVYWTDRDNVLHAFGLTA
jgi:hypothetical protein